jgi:hypothetical protein
MSQNNSIQTSDPSFIAMHFNFKTENVIEDKKLLDTREDIIKMNLKKMGIVV